MNDKFKESLNYFNEGDYIKGISTLEALLKINEESSAIYNNLGAAYMKIGNYDEAELNFNKAIKYGNFPNNIYYNLAELNTLKGDLHSSTNLHLANNHYRLALDFINIYLKNNKTDINSIKLKNNLEKHLNRAF